MSVPLLKIFTLAMITFSSGDGRCQFPSEWVGSWHHLGYDDPLNVTLSRIDTKGTCYQTIDDEDLIKKVGYGQFILNEDK